MYQGQINVRYAKSLFLLAREKNMLDEMKKNILLIVETFQENESLVALINYPVIKTSKKHEVLQELFKDKINDYALSFLLLIVKNKREKHIHTICLDFLDLYARHKGIKKAIITTAADLSRTQKENIKKAIEKKFKTSIELEAKVNPSLIGGIIIQLDDKQMDLSVASQIDKLKQEFYKIDFNNKSISK